LKEKTNHLFFGLGPYCLLAFPKSELKFPNLLPNPENLLPKLGKLKLGKFPSKLPKSSNYPSPYEPCVPFPLVFPDLPPTPNPLNPV
jgi:hypothetical protein